MNFKKTAAAVALAASFTVTPSHAYFALEVTQIASWAAQYAQMIEEYEQLVETYRSLNGARGMEALVEGPGARAYLPADFQDIMKNGYGNWKELRGLMDKAPGSKQTAKNWRDKIAKDEAATQQAYREASARIQKIGVLLSAMSSAKDAKDIQDLSAAIEVENTMIVNEKNKLAMLVQLQKIEDSKLQVQRTNNTLAGFHAPATIGK